MSKKILSIMFILTLAFSTIFPTATFASTYSNKKMEISKPTVNTRHKGYNRESIQRSNLKYEVKSGINVRTDDYKSADNSVVRTLTARWGRSEDGNDSGAGTGFNSGNTRGGSSGSSCTNGSNSTPKGAGKAPVTEPAFEAPKIYSNNKGQLTNGTYTLDAKGMEIHETGSTTSGKSQFLYGVNAEKAALDAATYADANNLWVGNKAKVPVTDGIVGVTGSGQPTNYINVYRTNTGFIHASPANPPN